MITARQSLFQTLKDFGTIYPHWRLGQTVENLCGWAMQNEFRGSFDVEDEKLATTAREHLDRRKEELEIGSKRIPTPLSPVRAELFHVFEKLAKRYPDFPLAQLIFKVASSADVNFWDVEDEQLLAAAKKHLEGSLEFDTVAKS
jgi:hypothetical protein